MSSPKAARYLLALLFALVIGSIVAFFRVIPGSFVPAEDQGYLISALMLPDCGRKASVIMPTTARFLMTSIRSGQFLAAFTSPAV